jgi:hypothetical protein
MSGPPYPPSPAAGSNAIGSFEIGVSPIGSIPPFDVWSTIISQYANSPTLCQLLTDFDQYIDPTQNIDAFYDYIWNVNTAVGYGLDVWGAIVGVGRVVSIPAGTYFGFNEQQSTVGTFGQSSFYSGETATGNFSLPDDTYRTLIFAKALANISNGSTPSINQILLALFPNRGNGYVTDKSPLNGPFFGFNASGFAETFGSAPFYGGPGTSNMVIYYIFEFILQPFELAIVQQTGVLPKPTGVKATVLQKIPS